VTDYLHSLSGTSAVVPRNQTALFNVIHNGPLPNLHDYCYAVGKLVPKAIHHFQVRKGGGCSGCLRPGARWKSGSGCRYRVSWKLAFELLISSAIRISHSLCASGSSCGRGSEYVGHLGVIRSHSLVARMCTNRRPYEGTRGKAPGLRSRGV
jgi:hypothetical protein